MKQSIQELANEIEAFGYEEPKVFLHYVNLLVHTQNLIA
ncbi:hypothetical protein BCAH1134_C0558 (plasmid) [Bacillus cereus AH1134]|nr:hypothetical protein BCAH1134_C0558 [Bacillus cereus AH1134]